MTGHASVLELDEAAAGLAAAGVRAHVDACAECRARLALVSAGRAETMGDPRFEQTLGRLQAPPHGRRFRWLVPLATAAAASVLLAVALRPAPALRPKGGAAIELIGRDPASPRAGEVLELRIAPGSHRFVRVEAIDEAGGTSLLYSGEGRGSTQLRVTPGKVRVVAAFSDQPLAKAAPGPGVEIRELEVRPIP